MGTRLIIIDWNTSFITKTNKKSKMQIPIVRVACSVCFLVIFQVFVTSSDNVIEPEAGSTSATPDQNLYSTPDQNQYANAYQVYQHWAQQQQHHPIHHKPAITNPLKVLKNRQDSLADDIQEIFGPDAAILLGTLGAVMGTLAAVGVTLNTFNTNSICTTVKAIGDTSLATTAYSDLGSTATYSATVAGYIVARFNLIEAKINGYATPSC